MGPKQKKTPIKNATLDDTGIFDSFSPVKVPCSPGIVKQGNLTGSARKLKDGAADLHNLTLRWRDLNVQGSNIVNEIANIKLETILGSESDNQTVDALPESLQPMCDKLDSLVQLMKKVVSRLNSLVLMSRGIAQLEKYNQPSSEEIVLFQTWDVTYFEKVYADVSAMYQKELSVKESISQFICHARDRNAIMFHTAAWIHEPYIENTAKCLVEAMLLETKHKT